MGYNMRGVGQAPPLSYAMSVRCSEKTSKSVCDIYNGAVHCFKSFGKPFGVVGVLSDGWTSDGNGVTRGLVSGTEPVGCDSRGDVGDVADAEYVGDVVAGECGDEPGCDNARVCRGCRGVLPAGVVDSGERGCEAVGLTRAPGERSWFIQ